MNGLEIALVVLVSLWTLIFLVVAIAIIALVFYVKHLLAKISRFVDRTEQLAEEVDLPNKAVMGTVLGFVAKNSAGFVGNMIKEALFKKKKKS